MCWTSKEGSKTRIWSGPLLFSFAFFSPLLTCSLFFLIFFSFPIIVLFPFTFFCLFVAVGGIGVWEDSYSQVNLFLHR